MEKEELEKLFKSIKSNSKKVIGVIITFIAIIAVISFNPFVKGDPSQVIISQSMLGDSELSCIEGGGWHWRGISQIYRYNLVGDFYFNSDTTKVNGKEWDGDNTDEDDIQVGFAKKATGAIRGHLQYFLPHDCEQLKLIHSRQKSDENLKHNLIRNKVIDAVTSASLLFNASDVIETKRVEFRDLIKTYLNKGQYKTYTETVYDKLGEDEVDSTGKIIKKADVQKYEVMKIKLDDDGNPILKTKSDLIEYGITVGTPEIVNITLDPLTYDRIKAIRDKEMSNIKNAAEAEAAKQTAITAEANGRARVAEAKANKEVEKIEAETEAEKNKKVAITKAEEAKEVARLNAEKAKYIADSTKYDGLAKAAADAAKRKAGLDPLTEANIRKETAIAIAEKIANSQGMWTPYIMGGSGNGNGVGDKFGMALEIDMISKVKKLSDELNK